MRAEYRTVQVFLLLLCCLESIEFTSATHEVKTMERSMDAEFDVENCTQPWFYYSEDDANDTCICGSELGGVVKCENGVAYLLIGYCMYYDNSTNQTTVVSCPYNTAHGNSPVKTLKDLHIMVNSTLSNLTSFMCAGLYRTGAYCEKCIDGYGVSVYTHDMTCYPCEESELKSWIKYLGLELGFVTVFYLVIAFCQINITSAAVNAFIFFSQIVVSLFVFELGVFQNSLKGFSYGFIKVLQTCYGIWNLDFLRSVVVLPFCVSPRISNLEYIALQYTSIVYPFFLILLTVILVKLYRRNVRIVVLLWFPFQKVFDKFRVNTWNSKAVVVNMLSSFLVLTYSKFIFNSATLLKAVPIYNMYNNSLHIPNHLFLQPSVLYFSKTHLPYAILVLIVTVLIAILPIFLIIYPSTIFQNFLKTRKSLTFRLYVHMFAANFQRCYKNRVLENRDHRYFAGFYFVLRIAVITARSTISHHIASWVAPGIVFLIGAVVIAIFRPYRQKIFNIVDGVLMLLFAIASGLIALATFKAHSYFSRFLFFVVFAIASMPLLYIIVYLAVQVVQRLREFKIKRYSYTEIREYGSDFEEPENGMGTNASAAGIDSQTGQSENENQRK